jgi:uncharacterized protein with von Willebrand factor type A (vWA) domain
VEVAVSRLEGATAALGVVDAGDRDSVYWALRCSLLSRLEQLDAFDAAFAAFWDGSALAPATPGQGAGADPAAQPAAPGAAGERRRPEAPQGDDGGEGASSRAGWSAVERLRAMDFAAYGTEELAAARRLVRRMGQALPARRSRRLRPAARGTRLDRRATLRAAIRSGGHPLELAWRRPASVPRRLVFLLDVSGSMEPYARVMLMFLQAVRQASPNLEAFTFGTRLTRLTRELAGRDPDRALDRASAAVPDWAGGTRIGDALEAFDARWGRRGLTRGAVVVILSDGWERGDLELLRLQMTRLQRAAHTLVWVNPLAGSLDYRPLAGGMAAALPFVDVFLAGRNLRDLEALGEVLEGLPQRRQRRALGAGPAAAGTRRGALSARGIRYDQAG